MNLIGVQLFPAVDEEPVLDLLEDPLHFRRRPRLDTIGQLDHVIQTVVRQYDDRFTQPEAVAVAPNGDVLVTGLYWGGPDQQTNVLLRRFDSSGRLRWSAEIDYANGRDVGRGLAVAPSGNVYVCGRVTTEAGDLRAYLARIVP